MAYRPGSPMTPGGETAKTRWRATPFTHGYGLDIGCGMEKLWPWDKCIGLDSGKDAYRMPINASLKMEAEDLGRFADGAFDYVYSSHLLEHIPLGRVAKTLAEWLRVTRIGGRIILYLPDADQYPRCRDLEMGIEETPEGCNQDHKWNVTYDRVVMAMEQVACGWDLVHFEKCELDEEYSLFLVFRKTEAATHKFSWREGTNPEGKPTACVVRYGGFGDIVQGQSICTALKSAGYHVTLLTTYPSSELVAYDPAIDRLLVQDNDQVPIGELGHLWRWMETRWLGNGFNKFVNLIESIESNLLVTATSLRRDYPPALRHKQCDINYMEFIFDVAGLKWSGEHGFRFYPGAEDALWREEELQKMRQFGINKFIMWSLGGSSRTHKVYPHMEGVWHHILKHYEDWAIVTVGDGSCRPMIREPFLTHPRMRHTSGEWTMRQVCTMVEKADVVCGPETGLLSCAAFYDMPKVVLLSHSSAENLTKHWKNTTTIWSPNTVCAGRGNNEVPACHKMLPTFQGCTENPTTKMAQCATDIKPAWVSQCLEYAMLEGKALWFDPENPLRHVER